MAPVNNIEQRAARKIAASEGIKYTEALRRVRDSQLVPSEIIKAPASGIQQVAPAESFTDRLTTMLKEENDGSARYDTSKNPLDFVHENSVNGRFAIQTAFGVSPDEKQHFVRSNHLSLCGSSTGSAADLLSDLLVESGLAKRNIVAWDGVGNISDCEAVDAHAELKDFNVELKALFARGLMNGPTSIVTVNGVESLLSSPTRSLTEDEREAANLLTKALLEGRRRNIAVYVAGSDPLYGSSSTLAMSLIDSSQVAIMGAMPLYLTFKRDRIEAMPKLTRGWLMTVGGNSWWQVRVPENG